MRKTLFSTFQKTELSEEEFISNIRYGTLILFPDESYFSARSVKSLLNNKEWIADAKVTVISDRIIRVEEL